MASSNPAPRSLVALVVALAAGAAASACWYDWELGGPLPVDGGVADSGSSDGGSSGNPGDNKCAASNTNISCTCPIATTCESSCPRGGCVVVCGTGGTCDTSCAGGGCTVECAAGATCTSTCAGGNCTFKCPIGSSCNNSCTGGGCKSQ